MGNNADKNWMVVKQKDGFEQLIFMGDVSPYRFAFNDKIKKITINTYATQIGQYAFYGCSELEEIIVNIETLDINKYAFAYCPKLKHVTFNYERKFDKFLSVNERAFLGCGIMEFCFSDETTYIDATKIKRNETYSDLHIQAVTKILQGMAEEDFDVSFSIDLQGEEFTKASNVIDIRPLTDGKFYLTDGGCLFSVLGHNPNLEIGWVKDYIEANLQSKKFFFKDGKLVSWCKDIDDAADVLLEMCRAIRMIGGLAYYLENADNTTEITEEEIDEALRALIKKCNDLTKQRVEDILLNMVGKNPDGDPDLRECMKIAYMHAKVKKMTEKRIH